MKRRLRDVPWAVLMLLPSVGLIAVWTIYPLVKAIQTGHSRCDITGRKCTDYGWGRYWDVFMSTEFQHALGVSLKLMALTVPTGLVLGVGLAVLADKQLKGIGFFRTVFSSTVATSVAVASLVWFVLLQPQIPMAFLSDIVYQFNNLGSNPDGVKAFDAARLLAESGGATTPHLITRHHIEQIAHLLAHHGAIFLAGIGEREHHEAKWRRLMG